MIGTAIAAVDFKELEFEEIALEKKEKKAVFALLHIENCI